MSNSEFLKWVALFTIGLGAILVLLFGEVRGESIVVVGVDGVSKSTVELLLQQRRLPGFQKLMDRPDGKFGPLFIEGFTLTVPSWTEFFTGLSLDQTGVIGNNNLRIAQNIPEEDFPKWDPRAKVYRGISYWVEQIPVSWTLMNLFQKNGHKVFFNSSKYYLSGNEDLCPFAQSLKGSCEHIPVKEPKEFGDSYLDELSRISANHIKKSKSEGSDFFLFVHLNPDFYAHHYGGDSIRHKEEVVRCSQVLEDLMTVADKRNTKFLVLSDHGFQPDGSRIHMNSEEAWFITDLPIHPDYSTNPRAVARMRDLTQTLISYFHLTPDPEAPRIRGRSLLD